MVGAGNQANGLVLRLSLADEGIRDHVTAGMLAPCSQFNVPIVGGHLHPDTPYSVIDVAILGTARLDSVIYSHTAGAGDTVIAAIDLDGRVHPSCALNWDSVTMKGPERVRAQIRMLQEIGEAHLVTAGKDISNPGALGSLGMLLEASGKGARVEVSMIPSPKGVDQLHWLTAYQGCGFVVTCRPSRTKAVMDEFARSVRP